MNILVLLVILMNISGCYALNSASTEAVWIQYPDGRREIRYKSDKEQIGMYAEVDPATGKFVVKVDKASAQDAAVQMSLENTRQLIEALKMVGSLGAQAAGVAFGVPPIPRSAPSPTPAPVPVVPLMPVVPTPAPVLPQK